MYEDEKRQEFLSDFLKLILEIIHHCIDTVAGHFPGMTEILYEICDEHFDVMKTKFRELDERIYLLYKDGDHTLVPYEMMTASVANPGGAEPIVAGMGGKLDMNKALASFEEDCQQYMQAFSNKAKIDTNGLLRFDALTGYFGKLHNKIQEEFRKVLDESEEWDEENVAVDAKAKEALKLLKLLYAEKEELIAFEKKLKDLMNC